ncbi:MAG TPA: hypothetical protein VF331_11160 [Polyangiales bacterium]
MQLLLGFAQEPSNQTEPDPNLWPNLQREQRSETIGVLARLLAKAAAIDATASSTEQRKEEHDD